MEISAPAFMQKGLVFLIDLGADCKEEVISHEMGRSFWGPGFWWKVVKELRSRGYDISPEDLGRTIAKMYYDFRPNEMMNEQMVSYGYSQCSKCELRYLKHKFKSHDPCDNCKGGE